MIIKTMRLSKTERIYLLELFDYSDFSYDYFVEYERKTIILSHIVITWLPATIHCLNYFDNKGEAIKYMRKYKAEFLQLTI